MFCWRHVYYTLSIQSPDKARVQGNKSRVLSQGDTCQAIIVPHNGPIKGTAGVGREDLVGPGHKDNRQTMMYTVEMQTFLNTLQMHHLQTVVDIEREGC